MFIVIKIWSHVTRIRRWSINFVTKIKEANFSLDEGWDPGSWWIYPLGHHIRFCPTFLLCHLPLLFFDLLFLLFFLLLLLLLLPPPPFLTTFGLKSRVVTPGLWEVGQLHRSHSLMTTNDFQTLFLPELLLLIFSSFIDVLCFFSPKKQRPITTWPNGHCAMPMAAVQNPEM